MKRFLSSLVLLSFLCSQFFSPFSYIFAVETDNVASNWTRAKAEHLARKVLFYPTTQEVDTLYQAGSATAAVDILFPSQSGPDRTAYEAELQNFMSGRYLEYFGTGTFAWNINGSNMNRYYLYRYYTDPYQAKAKLFSLFEDIYSVNVIPTAIEYGDIINLYNLLYKHTLGNYKTLAKSVLLNNPTDKGDFAASEFLNLLRQYDYNNPNENYAREMLQLFLMGEYLPGESTENESTRNYSEQDVASLARILTGFWSDDVPSYTESSVYYTGSKHNNSSNITFLPGNTGGVSFPFYDSTNDVLNLSGMTTPILGNNGLGDNTVDYIFSKKSHAIAMFLANKFFRFYVHANPSKAELESIANIIETNNFEIYPTIKWMLVQDFMYSDASMNAIEYYNPLELVIGLFRTLHASDPQTFDTNFYAYSDLLSRLGWNPYIPGSIFGRDGFDKNFKWLSSYTITQWSNLTMTVTADITRTGSYLISNIIPVTQSGGVDITMDDFIEQVEVNLLNRRNLPTSVVNTIKTYLTTSETGAIIPFSPNNITYRNLKFPSVFSLVLSQPEFLLKTGYDQPKSSSLGGVSSLDNATGALIIVELPGGYDWLNGIIEKDDYSAYQSYRTDSSGATIAQTLTGLVDIGDFYMNPYLAYSGGTISGGPSFKSMYDQGYLKIFNRVGNTKHSRDHNQAQIQMASYENATTSEKGILGYFTQFEQNSIHTFVMGTKRPFIYNAGNYVNLGGNDNRISHSNPRSRLNTNQRNQVTNMIMSSFTGRIFPGTLEKSYIDALKIHTIANTSVSQGGSAGVGGTTATQLNFVKTLLDNNTGKIFYLQNTGNGYDTHADQLAAVNNLDKGIGKAAADVSNFFNTVKDIHNVTIVMYSEFGRTNYKNGTQGTDHGNGGGIFLLTNNPTLQAELPSSMYGQLKSRFERNDWLGVGIDYRTIYGKIINALYGIPDGTFFQNFTRKLEDDISQEPAKIKLLHTSYTASNDTRVIPNTRFLVEGNNFDETKSSYIESSYSSGSAWRVVSAPFGSGRTTNYTRFSKDQTGYWNYIFTRLDSSTGLNEGVKIDFTLNPITNQYTQSLYSGSFVLPDVLPASINIVSSGSNSILRKHNNTNVYITGTTLSNTFLATGATDTYFPAIDGVRLRAYSGTTVIQQVFSSSGVLKWNGGFIIGESFSTGTFLPDNAMIASGGLLLKDFSIDKIARIGSDVLGVGMQLSKPVEITLSGGINGKNYYVLTSEDGMSWSYLTGDTFTPDIDGNIRFETNHFSLFALAQVPELPVCDMNVTQSLLSNGTTTHLSWTTLSADTVSISGIGNVTASGTVTITPPESASTTYTLTATNVNGSVTCNKTVVSKPLPSCSIMSAVSSIKNNLPVRITWTGSDSASAVLDPSSSTVPVIGNIDINPPFNATTNYTLRVSNDVGSGSCMTSITTYPNTAPTANDDIISVASNTESLISVINNDIDVDTTDTITLDSIVTMPIHGTLTSGLTNVSYTSNAGYCGADSFTYRVKDNDNAISNIATVTLHVSCSQNAPVSTGSTVMLNEDSFTDGTLTATDADGDYITYITASGVTYGTLSLSSTGAYRYTPLPDYFGTDTFTYYPFDGVLSGAITTMTFEVQSQNDAPIVVSDSGSTNINTATYINILQNDIDIDHPLSALTPLITTTTQSGTLLFTGGMMQYTPNPSYCGNDSFRYRLMDGSGTTSVDEAMVSIVIDCLNNAPVAYPDGIDTYEDTPKVFEILQNDTDPDFSGSTDMISFHDFQSLPASGTLTLTTSGSQTTERSNEVIMYTPNPNFCGNDSFTYRIHDSNGNISNAAPVTIQVLCVNDAPSVGDATYSGFGDTLFSGALVATDIDSNAFSYTVVSSVATGTLSLSASGLYTYVPAALDYSGSVNFMYRATDGSGSTSNTGTITFVISPKITSQVIVYTGGTISSTGSVGLFTGSALNTGTLIDLNGNQISLNSSVTTGSIIIPGSIDIVVDSGIWTGEILAPVVLPLADQNQVSLSDSGVVNALPSSTTNITYSYTPRDTIKAGSQSAGLALSGGYATLETVLAGTGLVFGSRIQIVRSNDGINWHANSPDASCIVDNELKCTFRTDHLTYFGLIEQVATPNPQVSSTTIMGGGGGGGGVYASVFTGLVLQQSVVTASGIVIQTPQKSMADKYAEWILKNSTKYPSKILAEKMYTHLLRTIDDDITRTNMIADIKATIQKQSPEYLLIVLRIERLWNNKMEWKQKQKLLSQ